MLKSEVPDLASQIELITAFTSEYMQEGPDGCLISQTYLQLIACFRWIESMDVSRLGFEENDEYVDLAELSGSMASSVSPLERSTAKEGEKEANVINLRQFLQSKQSEAQQDQLNESRYHNNRGNLSINDDVEDSQTSGFGYYNTSRDMNKSMMSTASFANKID